MLCQNCGKKEANVRYTQIINGKKTEMALCEECAQKLGIHQEFNFHIPVDFPSLLGDFLGEYEEPSLLSGMTQVKPIACEECGMTFDEFTNLGKFGCAHCYDAFASRIDPILKNIQGHNRHIGRKGKVAKATKEIEQGEKREKATKTEKVGKESKLEKLERQLKEAIKEERYEDAATIRDEIKKIEKK